MGQIVSDAIERYLASLNRLSDDVLMAMAADGEAAGIPIVDPEVGALLAVLTAAAGTRRALEIGTAIGYSGTWIARALSTDGLLITIEIDPDRAAQAKTNFARAGVTDRANLLLGDAMRLLAKVQGPFDLIFQDGDKAQYEPMLGRLVDLLRPGGILVSDNILWNGEVVPGHPQPAERRNPADTTAIAAYNLRLSAEPRLRTAWVPLRDGVAISVKR